MRKAFYLDEALELDEYVAYIRSHFPSLIVTPDAHMYSFVTKEPLDVSALVTNKDVGELLGYPCAGEIDTVDRRKQYYNHSVMVSTGGGPPIELFNNIGAKRVDHSRIVERVKQCFMAHPWAKDVILDVYCKVSVCVPEQQLIHKLMLGKTLSEDELFEFQNFMWNMEMDAIMKHLNLYSEFHRGVAAALLVVSQCRLTLPDIPVDVGSENLKKAEEDLCGILSVTAPRALPALEPTQGNSYTS